ncbi:TPA: recombinase RecT, partial [Citrobacter amalonaticus]|nr:recombinase RecT [Citrobacter amalonaticus]
VAMQAAQWQMNPFAVAQKTHLINGVLGYEAQLVNAVISRSGVLASRFEYEWYGPWEKVIGKFNIKKGEKGEYRVPGWTMADEEGIGIIIKARLKGEDQPRELDLLLAQARVRNSTLWADDPRQQLAYLAVKRWARLFCPDVILGVYTPDELDEREEKIINPAQSTQSITMQDINADTLQTTSAQEADVNIDDTAEKFRARIDSAETLEDATAVGNDINTAKPALGTALFTELKNKATRRYHLVKHRAMLDEAINGLPQPDAPDSATCFEMVEKKLSAAKRHLGDELHDKYRITLDDMKPEYVG